MAIRERKPLAASTRATVVYRRILVRCADDMVRALVNDLSWNRTTRIQWEAEAKEVSVIRAVGFELPIHGRIKTVLRGKTVVLVRRPLD